MNIADIFAEAQKSSINHKSLTKHLRKIEKNNESNRSRFDDDVKECILRCLEVAKSEKAGTNIVKFVCMYCAAVEAQEAENDEEEAFASITSQILVALLPFMVFKDKVVRYRATQTVSQLMGIIQEIDDDLYLTVKQELIRRIRDKVPAIRLEAVCALGRLLENEIDEEENAAQERDRDENEDDDDVMEDDGPKESAGLLGKLTEVLQHDTNADVRKALLLNLPVEPRTQLLLMERARDKDPGTRRALYTRLMPKMDDFRYLSLAMREKLLRWGLRDRDDKVRIAAAKMFSHLWIEQIANSLEQIDPEELDEADQPKKPRMGFCEPSMEALHELLERIDILQAGQKGAIGLEAMREFWRLRSDYFDTVTFEPSFWSDMDIESAFIARSFYDYCSQKPDAQARAEDRMPEVTRFGYHLQNHLNRLIEILSLPREDVDTDDFLAEEFIVEQLLHIAQTLDYTDEMGRRKLFSLLRDTISKRCLPGEITQLAIEALRLTCTPDAAGEREFISVVLEALAEIQDPPNQEEEGTLRPSSREKTPADDESFVSAQSEIGSPRSDTTTKPTNPDHRDRPLKSQEQRDQESITSTDEETQLLQLKCLHIAYNLFQNITCNLTSNISLDTLFNTLVIPAIHSTDEPVRIRAIECMGLACLISPDLAVNNKDLFLHCLRKGSEDLKIPCLQILCDCAVTHRDQKSASRDTGVDLGPFVKAFGYGSTVAGVATTCIAKLMMAGFYQAGEEGSEVREMFDDAIEEAQNGAVKGWELLGKVKAALVADEIGKGLAEEGERRAS